MSVGIYSYITIGIGAGMNKDSNNLLWLDLEMTGLDISADVIVEVACVVTNKDLEVIAPEISLVIYQPDNVLAHMKTEVREMHTRSGLIDRIKESTTSLQQAEQEVLSLLQEHCKPQTTIMCGNSIWQDRYFLMKYMPRVIVFLHYRMIDVTTIKELVRRWYDIVPEIVLKKKEQHRALDDVHESIYELKFYKKKYFIDNVCKY
jgi:oligoribonuclease